MTEKEKQLVALLQRALSDLVAHSCEYHHVGQPGLIDEIKTILKETK